MPFKDKEAAKAYHAKYRATHEKETKAYHAERREQERAYSVKYNEEHREERANFRAEHREELNARVAKRHREKRDAVLNHYGTTCACCPESERAFLTIDHVNGGGNKHRKEIGRNFTEWLFKNNFPEGYQTLCFNCNVAKHLLGTCPHQNMGPTLKIVESPTREEDAA
jgi:hypothetical protein